MIADSLGLRERKSATGEKPDLRSAQNFFRTILRRPFETRKEVISMPTIMHFEIPADNVERARAFYSKLFGWEIKEIPGMDYWMITTSGENPVGGGMMKRQNLGQTIVNYVDVPSVDKYAAEIEKLGGKIIFPKTAIPEMGYFAICYDTEKNTFGIWENNKNAK
jgi:predicted enzyme related to lactoylglutathione lyase